MQLFTSDSRMETTFSPKPHPISVIFIPSLIFTPSRHFHPIPSFLPHLRHFHPNVTTLCSGLRYRKSVSRLSVCLSVTFVHPPQKVEAFGSISSPLCTLAILWLPCKIVRRSSHGNPFVWVITHKRCSKYSDFRPVEGYLIKGTW